MAKEKEEEEEEKEKPKDSVELTEVVTQTAPAFKLPDGSEVNADELLVWIANLVYEIKKNTG